MSVKINNAELKKFRKEIEKALNESDDIVIKCVEDLALRLHRLVAKLTPVDTGWLKEGWYLGPVKKENGSYKVEIINPENYALYVEYGHRVVVDKITVGWVDGIFMMTIAETEIEKQKERIVKRNIEKWLKEKFK